MQEIALKDKIYTIRDKQVMLDRDLAELYGVKTKRLNEQVRRNRERFPERYCFKLTENEKDELVAFCDHLQKLKYSSELPNVFTEQGVSMLSTVLKSKVAIKISLKIIDSFVAMRHFLQENASFLQKFQQIDQKLITHDTQLNQIFQAIESKQLTPNQGIFYDGQIYSFAAEVIYINVCRKLVS